MHTHTLHIRPTSACVGIYVCVDKWIWRYVDVAKDADGDIDMDTDMDIDIDIDMYQSRVLVRPIGVSRYAEMQI